MAAFTSRGLVIPPSPRSAIIERFIENENKHSRPDTQIEIESNQNARRCESSRNQNLHNVWKTKQNKGQSRAIKRQLRAAVPPLETQQMRHIATVRDTRCRDTDTKILRDTLCRLFHRFPLSPNKL